jgi:hypothetical protein
MDLLNQYVDKFILKILLFVIINYKIILMMKINNFNKIRDEIG